MLGFTTKCPHTLPTDPNDHFFLKTSEQPRSNGLQAGRPPGKILQPSLATDQKDGMHGCSDGKELLEHVCALLECFVVPRAFCHGRIHSAFVSLHLIVCFAHFCTGIMPELLRIDHQSNVDAPTKAKALIAQAQSAYLLSPSQNGGKRIFPLAVQSEMFECTSWSFDEDTPRAAASSLYAQACGDNDQTPLDFAEKLTDDNLPNRIVRCVDRNQIILSSHRSSPLSAPRYLNLSEECSRNDICRCNKEVLEADSAEYCHYRYPNIGILGYPVKVKLSVLSHSVKLALPSANMIGPVRSSPHCHYTIENCASSGAPFVLTGKHDGGLLADEPQFNILVKPGESFCVEDIPFTVSLCTLESPSATKSGKRRKRSKSADAGCVFVNWTMIGLLKPMEHDEFLHWVEGAGTM